MKIMIDLGHPAHVHYFRHFIAEMDRTNNEILIVSRDKEVTFALLEKYNLKYFSRGKGGKSVLDKILYMFKADSQLLWHSLKFRPDLFLSFGSMYAAHTAFIMGKPHLAFDDTEHSTEQLMLYRPFTKVILTPSCFFNDIGRKQIRFNGYMELCYLHPKRYSPDPTVLRELNVSPGEKYVILRFVSWNASHDTGQSGFSYESKLALTGEISKYAKVFISSESELPAPLKKYQIKISPEKMHDVLAYASLFVGEGATMASECACLGTPAIYVNSLVVSNCTEQQKEYDLVCCFRNSKGVLGKALEILNTEDAGAIWAGKRENMLRDKIDVTAFMVWFVQNYPESFRIMKRDPSYQLKFK